MLVWKLRHRIYALTNKLVIWWQSFLPTWNWLFQKQASLAAPRENRRHIVRPKQYLGSKWCLWANFRTVRSSKLRIYSSEGVGIQFVHPAENRPQVQWRAVLTISWLDSRVGYQPAHISALFDTCSIRRYFDAGLLHFLQIKSHCFQVDVVYSSWLCSFSGSLHLFQGALVY